MKNENFDVDLIKIFNKILLILKNKYKTVIYFFIVFSFLGIFYSLSKPNIYSSSVMFVTQVDENKTSISSIASLAGLNMENEVFNVTPNTYPKILESISFKREILKTSLTDSLTIKEYLLLNKKSFDLTSILSFPAELFSELRSFLFSSFTENKLTNRINEKNNFLHVSEVEEELFLELDDIIEIDVNNREKFVEIKSKIDNPLYSSLIVLAVKKELQNRVINFKIESSKQILNFTQNNYDLKKRELEDKHTELSKFKDKNKIISSSISSVDLKKLENEYQILNTIFGEIALQLEKAKIQVTKSTPIFVTIKEVYKPNKRVSPSRTLIVISFSIFGVILSLITIIIKDRKELNINFF